MHPIIPLKMFNIALKAMFKGEGTTGFGLRMLSDSKTWSVLVVSLKVLMEKECWHKCLAGTEEADDGGESILARMALSSRTAVR